MDRLLASSASIGDGGRECDKRWGGGGDLNVDGCCLDGDLETSDGFTGGDEGVRTMSSLYKGV